MGSNIQLWGEFRQVMELEGRRARALARQEREQDRCQHEDVLLARVQDLSALAVASPQYLDEGFIRQYAQAHCQQLLQQKQFILTDFLHFSRDGKFLGYLRQRAPELITWRTWLVRALSIAEQLAVGPPPRPRRTAEEIRARKVRRKQARIDDEITITKIKIEGIQRGQDELDAFEDLDPELKAMLEAELKEHILRQEDEERPHKDGEDDCDDCRRRRRNKWR